MDFRWLAGFFDGEGCVTISKHPFELFIDIGQSGGGVLGRIKGFLGYGFVFVDKKHFLHFQLCGRQVERFLLKVLPYLEVKSRQVRLALQFMAGKSYKVRLTPKEVRWRKMHRLLLQLYKRRALV